MYKTAEGLYVRDKGEEGVRDQQREWNPALPFLSSLRNNMFLDLGGHVGWFIWWAMKATKNTCQVTSIEAHPETFKILSTNWGNHPQVSLIEGAVGSPGPVIYEAHKYSSCNSTLPVRGRNTVPVKQQIDLADVINDASLIKIDIEGAEYLLDTKVLAQTEVIVAELHHNQKGMLDKQTRFCNDLVDAGFAVLRGPKGPTFTRTCHVCFVKPHLVL